MDESLRVCGFCVSCCKSEPVPSINKKANIKCEKLNTASNYGCSVYADRPTECRTFQCFWLVSDLEIRYRPDRSDLLIMRPSMDKKVLLLRELKRGALKYPPNKELIERLQLRGFKVRLYRIVETIRKFEV